MNKFFISMLLVFLSIPAKTHAGDEYYPDPFIIQGAKIGNYLRFEVSPVLSRKTSYSSGYYTYHTDFPTQTIMGLDFEVLMSKSASFELWAGSVRNKLYHDFYEPFERIGLGFNFQQIESKYISTLIYFQTDYSCNNDADFLSLTLGETINLLIINRLNIDLNISSSMLVSDLEHGDYWGKYLNIPITPAFRASFMIIKGGHADAELLFPVYVKKPKGAETMGYMDMAVGYRQNLGPFAVGAAFKLPMNKTSPVGREQFGMILQASWNYF